MGKKDKRIRELEAEVAGLKRRIEMLEYQRLWIAPFPNYEPFPYRPSPTVPRPYYEYEITGNTGTITHASTDGGEGYHWTYAEPVTTDTVWVY